MNTPPTNSLPLESSPEKLCEPDHTQGSYSESEDKQSLENFVTSPFYSSNRFACLSEAPEPIVDLTIIDNSLAGKNLHEPDHAQEIYPGSDTSNLSKILLLVNLFHQIAMNV